MSAASELEMLILTRGGPEAVAEFQKIVAVNHQLTSALGQQNQAHNQSASSGEISFRTQQRLASSITGLAGHLGPVGHLWHTYEYAAHMAEEKHMSMMTLMGNIGPMIAVGAGLSLVMKAWEHAGESAAEYNKIAAELGQDAKEKSQDFILGDVDGKLASLKDIKGIIADILALGQQQAPEQRLAGHLGPEQEKFKALEAEQSKRNREWWFEATAMILNPAMALPVAFQMNKTNEQLANNQDQIGGAKNAAREKGMALEAGRSGQDWLREHSESLEKEAQKAQAEIAKAQAESVMSGDPKHNRKAEAIAAETPAILQALTDQAAKITGSELALAQRRQEIKTAGAADRERLQNLIESGERDIKNLKSQNPMADALQRIDTAIIPQEALDKTEAGFRKLGEKAAEALRFGLLTPAEKAKEELLLKLSNPHAAFERGLRSPEEVTNFVGQDAAARAKLSADEKKRDEMLAEQAALEAKARKIEHTSNYLASGSHDETMANFRAQAEAGAPKVESKEEKIAGAIKTLQEAILQLKTSIANAAKAPGGMAAPMLPGAGLNPFGEAQEPF